MSALNAAKRQSGQDPEADPLDLVMPEPLPPPKSEFDSKIFDEIKKLKQRQVVEHKRREVALPTERPLPD